MNVDSSSAGRVVESRVYEVEHMGRNGGSQDVAASLVGTKGKNQYGHNIFSNNKLGERLPRAITQERLSRSLVTGLR